MDRCPLSPNQKCLWQDMDCLYCSKLLLKYSLQQLRWSLPFGIGKHFRIYEHLVECNRKEVVK